ncbi:hypothetical protein BZL30_5417 [Mycobacterium kansasii]|uniref:Uncharacterized protein n=1 Tax=Mycobacterium kansasii TaxID=1768 RepID=A0A1V3X004_MYCKA|nr:hypothetical protein BZL30_5417 [Mycobacterium kansasii]
MFARVLGPFLAIVGAAVVARAPQMSTLLSEFEAVWAGCSHTPLPPIRRIRDSQGIQSWFTASRVR